MTQARADLRIAPTLTLPLDAVTQTFAVLGKRGSGKTTTAVVLTEELLAAGQPVVVIDPLDVTWGLRASRNGKEPGYPITVLGGDHADLPLEASAGAVLAEFVVESHAPVILSLRHFSLNDQRRFVTDFAERLYVLKGKQTNRAALHLVIDEVDEFCHQRIPAGHERLFGAIDRLVRRGRSAGIGVTMISQRPAVIHKDILSQAEVLICHQTISPQDRKALETWIEAHDAHGQRGEFMQTLAGLQRGEAWVWSPGWLDVFMRVTIRDRRTFDSSSTPKAGEQQAAPKQLAAVDLRQLETRMAATLEKVKADDPKELRRQIAELQRQIARPPIATPPVVTGTLTQDDRTLLARVEEGCRQMRDVLEAGAAHVVRHAEAQLLEVVRSCVKGMTADVERMQVEFCARLREPDLAGVLEKVARCAAPASARPPATGRATATTGRAAAAAPTGTTSSLTRMHRAMLSALAQHPDGLSKKQILVHTGYASSGPVSTAFADLTREGWVEGSGRGLRITDAGLQALGPYDPLPVGDALRAWLLAGDKLSTMEKALLGAVCAAYPKDITKGQVLERTGYASSGPVSSAFAKLVAYNYLIPKGPSRVKAAEELFS